MTTELPWLDEALEVYKERPDRIENILIWVYAQGVGNAWKALALENEETHDD